VIGGLITSTFLSLLVIPAVFTIVDDIEQWLTRSVQRLRGKPAKEKVVSKPVIGSAPRL
jgi:hypothetical protein